MLLSRPPRSRPGAGIEHSRRCLSRCRDESVRDRDAIGEGLESVVRYRVSTGRLEATRHKSIYFSPSGDYYYHPGGGLIARENVYITATDVGLGNSSLALLGLAGWRPLGWAPDADVLLMEANISSTVTGDEELVMALFDPGADTIRQIAAAGQVLGWGENSQELFVRDGDVINRISTSTAARPLVR